MVLVMESPVVRFGPLEGLFEPVAAPEREVGEDWAKLLDWDTTPADLRGTDVRSLKGFCEREGFKVSWAGRVRKDETYLRARRKLAQDRGLLSHQCFAVLEVLYEKALSGDVSAIKEWGRVYPDEMKAIAAKSSLPASTLAGNNEIPETLDGLELSELERLLEQMD